jgi:hypothetical protein
MLWFCRVPVWAREKDAKIVEICTKFCRKCRVFFIIWRFPFPDVDQSTDCRHTPLPWMTPMLGRKVCHRHFWATPRAKWTKYKWWVLAVSGPHTLFLLLIFFSCLYLPGQLTLLVSPITKAHFVLIFQCFIWFPVSEHCRDSKKWDSNLARAPTCGSAGAWWLNG